MNGKDIFLGMKYVGDDLIELAEYGRFPTAAEKEKQKKTIKTAYFYCRMFSDFNSIVIYQIIQSYIRRYRP